MFIGLIDEFGEAVPPIAIGRIPSEEVHWAVEYSALNRVVISNLNPLQMRVHVDVDCNLPKISLFREIDDDKPFIPIFDMGTPIRHARAGDRIGIAQKQITMSLAFRDNSPPNIEVLLNKVDCLKDEATQHLDFIHKIAFGGMGDFRAMARLYIKNWKRAHST